MNLVLSRRRMTLGAVLACAALSWLAWSMQPDRRLARAWATLIEMTEARRAAAIGRLLAADYSDRWGYDRTTITEDLRMAFFHFERLSVRTEGVSFARRGDRATIVATLRLDARGTSRADEARATINGLFAPFTFEWRQAEAFPWSWQLVRVDHPGLNPRRFRTSGLTR